MSRSGKPIDHHNHHQHLGLDQLRDSLAYLEANKPDFRELDLGSPVSPLRTRGSAATTTTSSSSSSSGSVSGTRINSHVNTPLKSNNSHSGELSVGVFPTLSNSTETSPATSKHSKTPHHRSDPFQYSGSCSHFNQSSVNSPATVNVLPTGNICPSGKILKTGMGMTHRSSKTDVLGSGTGNYGHGSIMRGGGAAKCGTLDCGAAVVVSGSNNVRGGNISGGCRGSTVDPEELKRAGNEMYKKGKFGEALGLYDTAIAMAPNNAAYRSNRAAALMSLGKVVEAVRECEEAVRLDPNYWRAHHRLGSLLIRLGHVKNARRHLYFPGQHADHNELQKLQLVETYLAKCSDARKVNDWTSALREADATISSGADYCPQLVMCRAEALLKLHKLEDAESCLSDIPILEPYTNACTETTFFGMLSEAYPFVVQAQIEMARGRFENAVSAAEKAGQINPRNVEVALILNNVRLVARARSRGNDLFKSERFTEACSAYGEGLRLDPSNSVLYCNRAACWFKLGRWERSLDDCNQALRIQPNYVKALLRRAASNSKLERWADAVRDYEALRKELPDDNDVAESLFHAHVSLKKSRGEEVYNLKFGGEVEEVSGIEQFRAAISSPCTSVVHFKSSSNLQCNQISPFVDMLCGRYPSLNFIKVNVDENPLVANSENVRIVPTFKIYKNGGRVKEIVCPSREMLEHSVRHYSF